MTKISIFGASGRMGKALIDLIAINPNLQLVGALCSPDNANIGTLVPAVSNIKYLADHKQVVADADVVIDFTLPHALAKNIQVAIEEGKPIVSGVTGMSSQDIDVLKEASKVIPVLYDRNMSLGMHIFMESIRHITDKLPEDYQVSILDEHHAGKKDAPSGTAIAISEIINDSRGADFHQNEIGFSSSREGEIIGTHKVTFQDDYDELIFTHRASSRNLFADGALKAALWLKDQSSGFYSIKSMINT